MSKDVFRLLRGCAGAPAGLGYFSRRRALRPARFAALALASRGGPCCIIRRSVMCSTGREAAGRRGAGRPVSLGGQPGWGGSLAGVRDLRALGSAARPPRGRSGCCYARPTRLRRARGRGGRAAALRGVALGQGSGSAQVPPGSSQQRPGNARSTPRRAQQQTGAPRLGTRCDPLFHCCLSVAGIAGRSAVGASERAWPVWRRASQLKPTRNSFARNPADLMLGFAGMRWAGSAEEAGCQEGGR